MNMMSVFQRAPKAGCCAGFVFQKLSLRKVMSPLHSNAFTDDTDVKNYAYKEQLTESCVKWIMFVIPC